MHFKMSWKVTKHFIFSNFIVKKKNQSYKARRSVKKHIANVSNNADFEQEDKGNIFDILENT